MTIAVCHSKRTERNLFFVLDSVGAIACHSRAATSMTMVADIHRSRQHIRAAFQRIAKRDPVRKTLHVPNAVVQPKVIGAIVDGTNN